MNSIKRSEEISKEKKDHRINEIGKEIEKSRTRKGKRKKEYIKKKDSE